jgi:hypothetical protein
MVGRKLTASVQPSKMGKLKEACIMLRSIERQFPKNQIVEKAQYEMQILGCS